MEKDRETDKEQKKTDKAESKADQNDESSGSSEAPKQPQPGPAKVVTPGQGEKVALRLTLPEGDRYRVTTVGLVALPAVQRPIGFARLEEFTFSACSGEGLERSCTLQRSYENYEAELPAGAPLARGEEPVRKLETSHVINASGERVGATKIEGDAEALEHPDARALAEAHLFFCLRLPSEPVAQGAQWIDTCRMRTGGQVVTRRAEWTLEKLDEDPDGAGKRAEIHVVSKYVAANQDGSERVGVARGVFFLWVDSGEPHLYRERVVLPLGDSGLKTKTSLNYQFAKVDPKDPEKMTRTDGTEFSGFRTLNDIRGESGSAPGPGQQPAPAPAPAPTETGPG